MGTSSAARERESVLTVAPENRRRTSIEQMRRDPPKGQVGGDVEGPARFAPPARSLSLDPARGVAFVRRRGSMAAAALFVAVGAFLLVSAGCSSSQTASAPSAAATTTTARALATAAPKPAPPVRPVAHLLVRAPAHVTSGWAWVARVHGKPAAWVAQRGGVTLMRFDQRLVHLALHAGSSDPGGYGWRYGDRIGPSEIHRVVAAFNGGFKLDYGSVGFVIGRRVAVPLSAGLGSIVTYTDGATQIGRWLAGVPLAGYGSPRDP